MTDIITNTRDLLLRLGYHGAGDIAHDLDTLLKEIDFESLQQTVQSSIEAKDTAGLINALKDLMVRLEDRGFYRPDAPTKLIRLLVNGLCLRGEDIFALLERANIPEEEKMNEQEFLASCAAITQLGYILLSSLVPEVKAASSGPHVFIIIDGFSRNSKIFVDFSIESIRQIDTMQYGQKENYYSLKTPVADNETSSLLNEYYSFFHTISGIGLSHNIHNNLGIAYDKIGMYEEAIAEFEEALRLSPGYIEVHNNLAVTYSRMGLIEEAVKELEIALELKPGYAEAQSNLGNLYAMSGKYEEAAVELEAVLKSNPDYADAHNNLGNIYSIQKKTQEAIGEFQEALRLNPCHALARSNLGSMYAEQGRYGDALREFQEALRLNPRLPEAYFGSGMAYYNMGSYERAVQALVRAVYLDSGMLEAVPGKIMLKVRQGAARLR